jgi:hypothetical protein
MKCEDLITAVQDDAFWEKDFASIHVAAGEMSGSLGLGVKLTGKRAIPIDGVRQANCDFASMDALRSVKKDANRDDAPPKSGDMSADMDAALRKLENRRIAAALSQTAPQAPVIHREQSLPQHVISRRNNNPAAKIPLDMVASVLV